MAFEAGHSGNPNGRKAGTPNNATAELRQFVHNFLNANMDRIQSDFDQLDPRDRLAFIEKLLKFVLPKQLDATVQTYDLKQITGMVIH